MKLRTVLISAAIAVMGASAFAQGTADTLPKPVAPAATSMPSQTTAPSAMDTTKQMPVKKHKVSKTTHKKHATQKTAHMKKATPATKAMPAT